jgi:pyruvate,water dikinase
MRAYEHLESKAGKGVRVAMRSSALGEDMEGTSFAGQYRSELNVSADNILQAYKEIVASKYSVPAMTYRLNMGIRDEDVAMCAGCLKMVEAVSGGVMYSRNPVRPREETVLINSVWGLPKSVVDGSTATDLFVVSRADPMRIVKREIPLKEQQLVCYPEEGVCRLQMTDEKGAVASLSDAKAIELAGTGVRIEEHYGTPQDMEWALESDGSIILLQCRPLQKRPLHEAGEAEALEGPENAQEILKGGVTASSGAGAGDVFIVKKDMDALRFPKGGVLVASHALPRWATVLDRASAVVTERGSVAGHLANVAREFGVPALFGVERAVERLKQGQEVTVDADALRVYEGRVEDLLKQTVRPGNLMEGSPVFEALRGAASHIVPLTLLDPDSPDFSPRNCRTFHDMTRYCHEKVVEEMFRFGKEHRFPERSSKQLFVKVPMQWWILNLDDGLKGEVGRYVRLEDIVCAPMLALWEGITAVPWEGPPAVDGRGFMSVMFQATANRALVPGMRSAYATRNYFMISKEYCSLSSRFGFHFSTIEALVGERSGENYIRFIFKGGAADAHRRHRRVLFVGEILDEYDFRTEVREDNLIARIEDREEEFMKGRLRILGYLIIHTRQLDMIMANDASVALYRKKIRRDIKELTDATWKNETEKKN